MRDRVLPIFPALSRRVSGLAEAGVREWGSLVLLGFEIWGLTGF